MPSSRSIIPADYAYWLTSLKFQQRAVLAVNRALVQPHHPINSNMQGE
jgi:hypothetical protein